MRSEWDDERVRFVLGPLYFYIYIIHQSDQPERERERGGMVFHLAHHQPGYLYVVVFFSSCFLYIYLIISQRMNTGNVVHRSHTFFCFLFFFFFIIIFTNLGWDESGGKTTSPLCYIASLKNLVRLCKSFFKLAKRCELYFFAFVFLRTLVFCNKTSKT